jgi:hypothetical protein
MKRKNSNNKFVGLKNIAEVANNSYKQICKKRDFDELKLIFDWHLIQNKNISDNSQPIKIIKKNNQKILTLQVTNSAMMMQLQYQKNQIIDNINQSLGHSGIMDIDFLLRPEMPKTTNTKITATELTKEAQEILDQNFQDQDDPQLKEVLQRFALQMKRLQQN